MIDQHALVPSPAFDHTYTRGGQSSATPALAGRSLGQLNPAANGPRRPRGTHCRARTARCQKQSGRGKALSSGKTTRQRETPRSRRPQGFF
jgi:hypothetical protein